jgi:hypothetical protein
MGVGATPATRSHELQDRLDLLSFQIDTLLDSLSGGNLLDARRAITRELHFEPRAEELQTIARMADEKSTEGPRHEFPRRFLGARILGDRTVRAIQESRTLDAQQMKASADLLWELREESRRLERELEAIIETSEALNQKDRDYLLRAGDALSYSEDILLANSVLAYRLAELADAAATESLEAAEPGLAANEREQIEGFTAKNITEGSSRVAVDAAAVRTLIEGLLGSWEALGPPSADDPAIRVDRDALLERLHDAQLALESVSSRIQIHQDEALVAKIESLADELREAGRGLFSIKLRLVPILRSPYEDATAKEAVDLRKVAELAAEEQAAAGGSKRETEDELYLGALKDMRSRKEVQEQEFRKKGKVSEAKRARRRMAVMLVAVGVLSITSAVVNFVILPGSSGAPEEPAVQELRSVAKTKRVETAGPMMITHVDGWNDLDDTARQTQVDKLGEMVADDGFQMMFVVNEYGEVAAVWDQKAGGGLVGAPE